MNLTPKQVEAVKAVYEWKQRYKALGTLDALAAKHGHSRQHLERLLAQALDEGMTMTSAGAKGRESADPFFED